MSQQNASNVFPSSAAMRVNEEIKRLQQVQQRMRAAATCPGFPSPGAGGLLTSSNMQTANAPLAFDSRPMFASFLQQQRLG